jgi:GDP-L-fucose synthase
MPKFQRIMVTGGGGVAGHGVRRIQKDYPKSEFFFPNSKECDLTSWVETKKYVDGLKPDAIVHLAAKSGGIGLSMNYPATLLRDNVLMMVHVLEAARLQKVKKVILTLSAGMYPVSAPLPLKEEDLHEGRPHPTVNTYAFAKRLVEPAVWSYRKEYGMNVIGLVPNGIFGPGDNFNAEGAAMVPTLIRRFYENREGSAPINVWGDGTPLREYTFATDLARAFMWCLENYDDEQILNVGNTEENSIRQIATWIAEDLGIDTKRLFWDTTKPNGVMRKSTDNSKFIKISKFKYSPFRQALTETVNWFVEESRKGGTGIQTKAKY